MLITMCSWSNLTCTDKHIHALLQIQNKPTIRGRKGSIKSNEQGMMTQ